MKNESISFKLLALVIIAGVIVALATYPTQQSWLSHKHHHHEGDARSSSAKTIAGDPRGN